MEWDAGAECLVIHTIASYLGEFIGELDEGENTPMLDAKDWTDDQNRLCWVLGRDLNTDASALEVKIYYM